MALASTSLAAPRRPAVLRPVLGALVALLGFVVAALAITTAVRGVREPPAYPLLEAKLAGYAAVADRTGIVVLGTSRLYRAVDPDALEAGLAAAGCDGRAWNLAVPAMTGVEWDRTLAAIRAARGDRPLVLVTEDPLPTFPTDRRRWLPDARARALYRWSLLDDWLAEIASYPQAGEARRTRLLRLAWGYAVEQSGLGLLSERLVGTPGPAEHDLAVYRTRNRSGFVPAELDRDAPQGAPNAEPGGLGIRNAAGLAADQLEAQLALAPARAERLAGRLLPLLRSGAAVFVVALPSEKPPVVVDALYDRLAELLPGAGIGRYDARERHPSLYVAALWFDRQHLDGKGAVSFSRDILAPDLCRHLRGAPLRQAPTAPGSRSAPPGRTS